MKRWPLVACLVGYLAASSATMAQVRDLTLDPALSQVTFTLGYWTMQQKGIGTSETDEETRVIPINLIEVAA